MTFVANRIMRITITSTITPIIIIILMFFHQYFLATRVEVLWKESAVAWSSPVLPIKSSNCSPRSSTLLMLSFRITFTSLTWPCTWSILLDDEEGEATSAGGGLTSAMAVLLVARYQQPTAAGSSFKPN